jgi:hypothetical protein
MRKKNITDFRPAMLSFIFLWALASSAQAYIDPVTGSFLLQGAIGGIAAVLASFRSVRLKVIGLFVRKRDPAEPAKNEPQ